MRVRYLHSDIDTVERAEIIRDLRLGVFDVLVGINLLREGLDIPEVSLVAILDADKEGFLRSDRSLIQTIGRAARHLNGKAILYADRMTDSMKRAIGETDRRRAKQVSFNAANNITPRGVTKKIQDVMRLGGAEIAVATKKAARAGATTKAANEDEVFSTRDPAQFSRQIAKLEKEMKQAAINLEFEKAARIRDQLRKLKEDNLRSAVA